MSDRACVIIADDHGLFRRGLRQLLEGAGFLIAAEASSGEGALECAAANPGCVMLLDIMMPDLTGLEVVRRLNERREDVKVIMLSAREDCDAVLSAISSGARGFMSKCTEPDELFAAIDLVARGGTALGACLATTLGNEVRELDRHAGLSEQRRHRITERELEVLRLLATAKSPAQIASDLYLSTKTVQNHIQALYRKLNVGSRSAAVVEGMELHLIQPGG